MAVQIKMKWARVCNNNNKKKSPIKFLFLEIRPSQEGPLSYDELEKLSYFL